MSFAQRIYYNDKPLILTTNKNGYKSSNQETSTFLNFSGASARNYSHAVQQMERQEIKGVIIEDNSVDALWSELRNLYLPIEAAGGVVFNEHDEVLMIYRRGKWDLPKGKLDDGEEISACALREVSEETGLQTLEIESKICDTYHIYTQYNKQFLKKTAWYKMIGTAKDILTPQKEENILEARWVSREGLTPLAAKSYEAVREVLYATGLNF